MKNSLKLFGARLFAAGVALAVILSGVRHISDTVFLEAAKVRNMTVFSVSIFALLFSCSYFLKTITLIFTGTSCGSVLQSHFACWSYESFFPMTYEIFFLYVQSLFFFQALAEQLTDAELEKGRLYPPLSNIREVSMQMAVKARWKFITLAEDIVFGLNF